MNKYSNFVHLQVYSEYTFDYGIIRLKDYVDFAVKNNINVLSLTDKFNLFSTLKFYNSCVNSGIKPIIGCEIYVDNYINNKYSKLLLLCKNNIGYGNLLKIISKSYSENVIYNIPLVKSKWLTCLSEGLIAIGLGVESDVGSFIFKKDIKSAIKLLNFWNNLFFNSYYLSISKTNEKNEDLYIDMLLDLYDSYKFPIVAVNSVYYLEKVDLLACVLKDAINSSLVLDINESNFYLKEKYFKSFDEMFLSFNRIPNVLYNTVEISKRCNVFLNTNENKNLYINKYSYLSELKLFKNSLDGMFELLDIIDKDNFDLYVDRLYQELHVVNLTGYADYFLITNNLVRLAYESNILIGPARGSGGGSFIAYSLGITAINPFDHGLLFERFLNKERVSSPDFDIDLCIDNRDFFIDHILDYYNTEIVAQISTFGIMSSNAVLRDIGRALGYSYFFVDKISKLMSKGLDVSLKFEYENNKEFIAYYNSSNDVKRIVDLSIKLEGIYKNVGKHAGGVVISYRNLVEDTPLYYTYDDNHFVTQYDKDDIEKLGLIKFDFLGLKTLTILEVIEDYLNSYLDIVDYSNFSTKDISLENDNSFYMFSEAKTIGVFQLESRGIRVVLKRLKPNLLSEINALLALYRPGPLKSGMVDDFIDRKLGVKEIIYPHNILGRVLGETYGVIVYQEQVMKIAQELANYTLGLADLLRVAISKKKIYEMDIHFERFLIGGLKNDVTFDSGREVFELLKKFAGYGFNKSHSVGYGVLTYDTAWLKANYFHFYMVVLLSSEIENEKKIKSCINDCRDLGLDISLPNINKSLFCFTFKKNKILFGFGAVKGLGESIIIEILENRGSFGCFKSFYDFLCRINFVDISRSILNSLILSGCFDDFSRSRIHLLKIVSLLSKFLGKVNLSFLDYCNFCYRICSMNFLLLDLKKKRVWSFINELKLEKKILCEFVSMHPLKYYINELFNISTNSIFSLKYISDNFYDIIFGIVLEISFEIILGSKLVFIYIYDLTEIITIVTSSFKFYMYNKFISKDEIIIANGFFKRSKFYEKSIYQLIDFRVKFVDFIQIDLFNAVLFNVFINKLQDIFYSKNIFLGKCFIKISFYNLNTNVNVNLSSKWRFLPSDEVLYYIKNLVDVKDAYYVY